MNKKEELTAFIDQGVKIRGEMEFENTVRIDGVFEGKIKSGDTLIVGENGLVDGEIDVASVSVIGTVRGKIRARRRLEIQQGGRVYAQVNTPSLMIVDGGLLQGNCQMGPKESEQTTELKAPPSSQQLI